MKNKWYKMASEALRVNKRNNIKKPVGIVCQAILELLCMLSIFLIHHDLDDTFKSLKGVSVMTAKGFIKWAHSNCDRSHQAAAPLSYTKTLQKFAAIICPCQEQLLSSLPAVEKEVKSEKDNASKKVACWMMIEA